MRMFHVALVTGALTVSEAQNAPEQLHLAFAGADTAGHPTGVNVAWYTPQETASVVAFGRAPDALTHNATGAAPIEYLAGSGFHHNVRVTGLEPSTQYYYKVGNEQDGWSSAHTFKTAPQAADADQASYQIALFGDMGYLDSSQRPMVIATAGLVKHWSATVSRVRLEALKDGGELDWVWHLGDIGYVDDAFAHHPLGFYYESTYNKYMNWLQNITATYPYMVSAGNHESECHSPACIIGKHERALALSNFSAYNHRWHMPASDSAARDGQSMWASWNYGPVHFVSINTETDWPGAEEHDTGDSHDKKLPAGHFGEDGEYLAWLEADLKAASEARAAKDANGGNGNGPSFIVAGGHRPHGDIKSVHTELFSKYGVDLYVAGHGHSYTRGTPVNGTTYIMAGGAGCDEMSYLESDLAREMGVGADWAKLAEGPAYMERLREVAAPGYAVPAGSEAFKTGRISIGALRVNATALDFRLLDSVSGEVLDSTLITKADQDARRAAFSALQ